jgi:phosphoesterase RecJ-like protein
VSFRSKGRVDVSAVAARFGGGGHRNAAGCTVPGTLADVRKRVLDALAAVMS